MNSALPGLMALLDALEKELLAAPAEEVRDAWPAAGPVRQAACEGMRTLLDEAIAASDDGSAAESVQFFGVSRKLRPGADGPPRPGASAVWNGRPH